MSKYKDNYDDDYDDYDDDYYDDYDEYDDYAKPAAVMPKKPVANNNKQNNNKQNNNNNNKNSNNNNNNNNNKNTPNNKNNTKANDKAAVTQPSTASSSAAATTTTTTSSTTTASSTAPANKKVASPQDLCSQSWIKEKNTQLGQLWVSQNRATQLSSHILMIGHVDSGKSSLLGRLLITQGRVGNRTLEQLQKEASQIGKGSFALAWVCDEQASERARGVTVDVASQWFNTLHRTIYSWDCPGHRDFVANMLSAANHAKSAILLVSARTGEFESGIGYRSESQKADDGIKNQSGQTREHALLAYGSGVRNIIVAVNKMDEVNYDSERFLFICRETKKMLASIGYDVSPGSTRVRYVPCSAVQGINIASSIGQSNSNKTNTTPIPSQLSTWYKGPSLIDLIDTLPADNGATGETRQEFEPIPITGPNPNPFSLAVHETFISPMFGLSIHGKVLSGSCLVKEKIVLYPSGLVAQVKGIECKNEMVDGCFQGDVVTLQIKLNNSNEDVNNTMTTNFASDPYPPQFGTKIIAHIHTNMTLGAIPLIPGANLLIHTQHLYSIGKISRIIHSHSLNETDDDYHHPDVIVDNTDTSEERIVAKKRMINNHSISVVEITLQIPLPLVHLPHFKSSISQAQKLKQEHLDEHEREHGGSKAVPVSRLELEQYSGPVDRICIRRDDETVATGIVLDAIEEQRYDFIL